MKSKSKSSRVTDRYGLIEALEPRIAPAAVTFTNVLPPSPKFVTFTFAASGQNSAQGGLLVKAGEVLTTGPAGSGAYLLYVESGQVLVHATDLNNNGQFDYNEITGLSVGNGARFTSFVDIHGDIVTDLNPDGTLSDNGKGDVLLDSNIAEIDLRSLSTADFVPTAGVSEVQQVANHLAMSSYSIFGNIYAGGGLGIATDPLSGLHINTAGAGLQAANPNFDGLEGTDLYQPTQPTIGSIYVGSSASGQAFTFGSTGSLSDIHGNLLAFTPAPGEPGASIYNISSAATGEIFNIGTIHAGDGGFNAPGGNIVNVTLQGDNAGTYQLIAGNAGTGTVGQNGGSITNFMEVGAILSEVVLKSGNGGTGLTGVGGNAGQITFNTSAPIQINAHVVLDFGSGGDGYKQGGAGAGTAVGTFETPEGKITQALSAVTSWHPNGSIGSNASIDFNGDGFSDAVFSTTNPDQVVVAFGGYNTKTNDYGFNVDDYIYLNAPAHVQAITVGDFTGAINPVTHQPELDIAVASGNQSFAGIEVYLSEYNPKTGAFEGFSDPLFSPLPSLADAQNSIQASYPLYTYTSAQVTHLVSGDFEGTGVTSLGVVENLNGNTLLFFMTGETDASHPAGTGYFFANAGNINILEPSGKVRSVQNVPFLNLSPLDPVKSIFKATALEQYTPTLLAPGQPQNLNSPYDVIIFAGIGANGASVVTDAPSAQGGPVTGFFTPVQAGGVGFGQVDTNRALGPTNISLAYFDVQDFTITMDQNNPAVADIVAVSQAPVGFIETIQGTPGPNGAYGPNGSFTFSGNQSFGMGGAGAGDNSGAYFNIPGFTAEAIVSIPNGNFTPSGAAFYSNVAVLDYNTISLDTIHIFQVSADLTSVTDIADNSTITPGGGLDTNTVAFGTYNPHPAASPALTGSGVGEYGFLTADPLQNYPDEQAFAINQPAINPLFPFNPWDGNDPSFKDAGYFITGGHGGNSQSGAGGAGGSLGQSITITGSGITQSGTGTLSIVFPTDPTYEGLVRLVGGAGGNGFGNGGAGGNLNGISLTYPGGGSNVGSGTAVLLAGNGGQSLTAIGGAGGSLSQLFIDSGEVFVAGDGGIGVVGGAGGSIFGNSGVGIVTSVGNNTNADIVLHAGAGATGITGGGAGGNINSFVNLFPYEAAGFLNYTAGAGGNAVAGIGGLGGSVINSSPSAAVNYFTGDIYLAAGAGGSGLYGGGGGSVTNFVDSPTIKDVPTSSTIIAGNGGAATLGQGGAGGAITDIAVAASAALDVANGTGSGTLYTFSFTDVTTLDNAESATRSSTDISYNRMVAGAGGDSVGGSGGPGGSIAGINSTSTAADSQNVVAAGAGGNGLTAGGAGGSVISANVDAGSALGVGKVLVIAGDGGSSSSVKPASTSASDIVYAIGGVNGPGGHGGSIVNFVENLSTATHVDLIAGNGGATLNHSVAAGNATVDNSGVGGSILNVDVYGSIGNSDPTAAIISYNNIFTGYTAAITVGNKNFGPVYTGTTMQGFVTNYILGDPSAPMTDGIGNVGLVAGEAGQVEGGQASFNGVNGSVSNIAAENIMSMIAGNVDQVALIQSLTNYGVTINGGILGAPKDVYYNPQTGLLQTVVDGQTLTTLLAAGDTNYISPDGGLSDTPLPGGGELIDGAFIAGNVRKPESIRDFVGTT